jgi:hypothetical protein
MATAHHSGNAVSKKNEVLKRRDSREGRVVDDCGTVDHREPFESRDRYEWTQVDDARAP